MDLVKLMAGGGIDAALDIEDVFQTYVRAGTGAEEVVTTGLDLSTEGGMVWSKGRSGATDHALYDTERGATLDLVSNSTAAETTQAQGLKSFGTTGHTWGTLAKINTSAATYVDFVFRKAPRFFDVVTYTGNGVAGREIAHELGVAPGMIIVKRLNGEDNWVVYHRSPGATKKSLLNDTVTFGGSTIWGNTEPTDSVFTVDASSSGTNENTFTYVAYLFAHDPGDE